MAGERCTLFDSVHKMTGASHVQQLHQPQSTVTGLQQYMPAIEMPLLVDSADPLGMDSDDLVPTLTVCVCVSILPLPLLLLTALLCCVTFVY